MRKTIILLAAIALPVASANATWDNRNVGPGPKSIANDGASSSASQSSARATSGSVSGATARGGSARAAGGAAQAAGGQGGSATQNVTVGGSGGSDGGSGGGYGGQATALFLPPNPGTSECIKGFGVGGTGREVGGLLSYAWHEGTCQALREGMQFWGIGLRDAAYGRWCQDGTLRQSLGNRCDGDKPRIEQAAVHEDVPDWCWTASAGERRQHRECLKGNR